MAKSLGIRMGRSMSRSESKKEYALFWKEMKPYVANAVILSFAGEEGGMREPTMTEVRERSDYCKRTVDQLRQELGWSKFRIRETLPTILRAHLAGIALPMDGMIARSTW